MGLFNWWANIWEKNLEEDFNKTIRTQGDILNLDCEGAYTLKIREWKNHSRGVGGTEYLIDVDYVINASIENELSSKKITGSAYVTTLDLEIDAYKYAIENTKKLGEEVLKSMQKSIAIEFKKQISLDSIDKLKQELIKNSNVHVRFKAEVEIE